MDGCLCCGPKCQPRTPFTPSSYQKEELAKAQREDKAVEEKETNTILMSDMRETVNRAARKLLH